MLLSAQPGQPRSAVLPGYPPSDTARSCIIYPSGEHRRAAAPDQPPTAHRLFIIFHPC